MKLISPDTSSTNLYTRHDFHTNACNPLTGQPTSGPSGQPSSQPSSQPTSSPTGLPSGSPSAQPSSQPSQAPTVKTAAPTVSNIKQVFTSAPAFNSQKESFPTLPPTVSPTRPPTMQPTISLGTVCVVSSIPMGFDQDMSSSSTTTTAIRQAIAISMGVSTESVAIGAASDLCPGTLSRAPSALPSTRLLANKMSRIANTNPSGYHIPLAQSSANRTFAAIDAQPRMLSFSIIRQLTSE